MAKITINEISQNYLYAVSNASYATVAMPLTSCWGPGYVDPNTVGKTDELVLEETVWQRFPATQAGVESFVATYRGASSNYRLTGDYSYQMAMTLLTAGYDILACRLSAGAKASHVFSQSADQANQQLNIQAKYPGTFGNNLYVVINKVPNANYWNIITYIIDSSGSRTAVENIVFAFELDHATDSIPYIEEVESNFLTLTGGSGLSDSGEFLESAAILTGGTDVAERSEDTTTPLSEAYELAKERYFDCGYDDTAQYLVALKSVVVEPDDITLADTIRHREWVYTSAYKVYDLLEDKLTYSPNRVISPGWDDQDISQLSDVSVTNLYEISPLHRKLMSVAYNSRCATAYIDIPKCLPRSKVYSTDATNDNQNLGYAQRLSRASDIALYASHSALFVPWGQYTYVGTSKMFEASPSFLALMIERAMILNQSIQYEWLLPTTRKQSLNVGKFAYNIPQKLLNEWQQLEGVSLNVVTNIPDLGTSLWGNSTLFEVPPATYQALANLSTRKLVNAVEDLVYRCGIAITFRYNNDQAYSSFVAGCTPLLDTMVSSGAIEDYAIKMSADINGVDRINANTVVGQIYLVINGVVNDINIDLICLPPGTDLTQYQA